MRSLVLPAIVLLASHTVLAQSTQITAPPATAREVHRDLALEKAVKDRRLKIAAVIQSEAGAKLDVVTRAVLDRLASARENADALALTQQEVRSKFAPLSTEQSNLLSFFVLADVSSFLSHPDMLKKKSRAMNEMSETTSLRLQMKMDGKSKFSSTLSNLMKTIADTQDSLVENLK